MPWKFDDLWKFWNFKFEFVVIMKLFLKKLKNSNYHTDVIWCGVIIIFKQMSDMNNDVDGCVCQKDMNGPRKQFKTNPRKSMQLSN